MIIWLSMTKTIIIFIDINVRLVQLVEHCAYDAGVVGSSPSTDIIIFHPFGFMDF